MSNIIGFTLQANLEALPKDSVEKKQRQALGHYGNLERETYAVGNTTLDLWGRPGFTTRVSRLADGSLLALIGSPLSHPSWPAFTQLFENMGRPEEMAFPWDGRAILLRISGDGRRWALWNDWLGSIPVFYANPGHGRIASTLEPVVVAAGRFSQADMFMPGLMSLFVNGHYLSDWTLFKGMKVMRADSMLAWDENDLTTKPLHTVEPTQDRWEDGWSDLIDQMYTLSREAISAALHTRPRWTVPLSSGLDSRLIAAVAADVGADIETFAYGSAESQDVIYSKEIARTLNLPWKHIELPKDLLVRYTRQWSDLFGSAMHFHGMYQMAFLDQLRQEGAAAIMSGFVGDSLSGDAVESMSRVHARSGSCQIENEWYSHWAEEDLRTLFRDPQTERHLSELADEIKREISSFPGARFQQLIMLELRSRQRFFTYFQSSLCDYWEGIAAPFINREYAQFCLSLPRLALEDRKLLGLVYRRYYGPLAVIPGTYAENPFIPTGSYLLKKRLAKFLPPQFIIGPLSGFKGKQLRMTMESVRATGREALWPIFDALPHLEQWLDIQQIEPIFQSLMDTTDDIRPLRKLQSIQTLAYRLLTNSSP